MKPLNKILIGTGIVAFAAGVNYAIELSNLDKNLINKPKVSVHSISTAGLTLRVDVLLKNPTPIKFRFKFPFVNLIYNNVSVGSSQAVNKIFTMPSGGELTLDAIYIQIPTSDLLAVAKGLLSGLIQNKSQFITVRTTTKLTFGILKIPYDKSEKLPVINKKKTVK